MTGGDVAPLGTQAVTKIHQIIDWVKKSCKGLLLFIDEADAFLSERNSTHMSEAQRSALNALLFRTGDQPRDIVLVLATNRPGNLDSAITDHIDEVIEFPIPGEEERFKLLNLYLHKYLSDEVKDVSSWR
ncbi:AAA-type ATPase family protein [Euphorbia peplus]|nr:AAA-type ATPase family protein [Euphorbia peplus]